MLSNEMAGNIVLGVWFGLLPTDILIAAVTVVRKEENGDDSFLIFRFRCGRSSAGRVRASQACGRGFESRRPLHPLAGLGLEERPT